MYHYILWSQLCLWEKYPIPNHRVSFLRGYDNVTEQREISRNARKMWKVPILWTKGIGTLARRKEERRKELEQFFSFFFSPPAAREFPSRFAASTSHGNSHSSSFPKGLVFTRVRRVIWAATQGPFCITGRVIMAKPPRTDAAAAAPRRPKQQAQATLQRYEFKLLLKQPARPATRGRESRSSVTVCPRSTE